MTNKNNQKTVETLTHDEARRKHIPTANDDKIHLPSEELVASILEKEQRIMEIDGDRWADQDTSGEGSMKRKTAKPKILQEPAAVYNESAIVIYQTPDGVRVDIKLEKETVWLSLNQMTLLFDRDKSVISRHLRNIFKNKELDRDSVVAYFATTATDGKIYNVEYFNLDAVISVGYRVNSKRGTQFRIWATSVLRDHLLKGYSLNERRLRELNQTIRLIADVASRRELSGDEAKALLSVVSDYSFALDLLDDYDHQRVAISVTTPGPSNLLTMKRLGG